MIRHTVTSSNVEWVAYDSTRRQLFVQFKSGLYQYDAVPSNVLPQLLAASSTGSYVHAHIRSVFPFTKIARVVTELPILVRETVQVIESGILHLP